MKFDFFSNKKNTILGKTSLKPQLIEDFELGFSIIDSRPINVYLRIPRPIH